MHRPKVFISIIAFYHQKEKKNSVTYYHYPHFVDGETELRYIKKFAQGHRNDGRVKRHVTQEVWFQSPRFHPTRAILFFSFALITPDSC